MSSLLNERQQTQSFGLTGVLSRIHLDALLLLGLLVLLAVGLMVLYSAGGQDTGLLIRQLIRMGTAFIVLFS